MVVNCVTEVFNSLSLTQVVICVPPPLLWFVPRKKKDYYICILQTYCYVGTKQGLTLRNHKQ